MLPRLNWKQNTEQLAAASVLFLLLLWGRWTQLQQSRTEAMLKPQLSEVLLAGQTTHPQQPSCHAGHTREVRAM